MPNQSMPEDPLGDSNLDSAPFEDVTPDLPGDLRLWRYVDLAKFADLLFTREVYFHRIDRYEDPLEGTLPSGFQRYFARGLTAEQAEEFRKTQADGHDAFRRRWIYTNSWHARPDESYAFWRIYGGGGAGIAIVSSVDRLRSAFTLHHPIVRKVEYINFDDEAEDYRRFHRTDRAFWHKHRVYDYENEVRAILQLPMDTERIRELWGGRAVYERLRESPSGVRAPIELDTLVDEIFVTPFAQPWFLNVVRQLCVTVDLDVPIRQSGIRLSP